ncbi:MAG: hypothetical protein QOE35_3238 [Actinomycetota bacterium]|jgi:hypothetical protein
MTRNTFEAGSTGPGSRREERTAEIAHHDTL